MKPLNALKRLTEKPVKPAKPAAPNFKAPKQPWVTPKAKQK